MLVFERSADSSKILVQMMRGFGAAKITEVNSLEAARFHVQNEVVDIIIADPEAAGGEAMEFLRWLRRSNLDPNRFTSILLVAGHIKDGLVKLARDSGANFVIAKPLAPKVLLDRILWVASDKRPFVDAGVYVGPDRRFHTSGLPMDRPGRRAGDEAVSSPEKAMS